jgi:hypothetical protein
VMAFSLVPSSMYPLNKPQWILSEIHGDAVK